MRAQRPGPGAILGVWSAHVGERAPGTTRTRDRDRAGIQAVKPHAFSPGAHAGARAIGRGLSRRTCSLQPPGRARARAQTDLGYALFSLHGGPTNTDTAKIAEAIAAYRAALEECTRERTPLDWARIQRALGLALQVHGHMGTSQLSSTSRKALEIWVFSKGRTDKICKKV
jgi:hypothetical protein